MQSDAVLSLSVSLRVMLLRDSPRVELQHHHTLTPPHPSDAFLHRLLMYSEVVTSPRIISSTGTSKAFNVDAEIIKYLLQYLHGNARRPVCVGGRERRRRRRRRSRRRRYTCTTDIKYNTALVFETITVHLCGIIVCFNIYIYI